MEETNEGETKLTATSASILKQDQNTRKVEQNA